MGAALMGAGLDSGKVLTTSFSANLWSTYVVQRRVYGLEVQKLLVSRTDVESLEKFQRKCLRQIQVLLDNTPNCVTLSQ